MSKKVRRLFEGFRPTNYAISINPDRDTMTISGSVVVTGKKVGRPSQRLTFHQHGLKITSATIRKLDKKNPRDFAVSRINHQRTLDEVRLHTDELMHAGDYRIELTFSGTIKPTMEGVYPCTFKHDGIDKQLIATQFESHAARRAFPCIDEPEAKATFDLTLTSPSGETVLANTPIKHQRAQDGSLITTFETTPVMSTYLLAFAYGDMRYIEKTTKNNTILRVYATPDNIAFGDFALDVAQRCLEYFEDYFAIPFPLPKCDFVALPDFAAGAMENWGMITFREQGLLVDPKNTSLPNKQYVAEVICHELTHQWFGNLVTMRWWTDLWLNEGFANVMAYMAVDKLFPEWEMMTQYIVEEQQLALKLDALENTHSIEVAVHHPDEIRTIFDAISYSKGGSSILMLSHYLGEETFRDGLRKYLKDNAYSNTDTVDLWDALESVSKKPIKNIMASWTQQPGYPVLLANVKDKMVEVTQEQFFINPIRRKQDSTDRLWPIALNAGADAPTMMDTTSLSFETKHPLDFKMNQGQTSFCRVIYNPEHLKHLSHKIANGKMPAVDRLGILSDAFESAKAGYSDTVSALKLMESYKHESNDVVWDILAANFGAIRRVMNDDTLRESTKPYGRQLVAEQLARLGWDAKPDEPHFDSLLRLTILGIASICDDSAIVDEALKRFDNMKSSEDIAPDLRGIIYTTAARKGDEKTFAKLLDLHDASTSPEERVTLSAALTNFEQPELIDRALKLITSDKVRLQDTFYWISYGLSNRFARQATWEWMKDNWAWLKKNLGSDTSFTRFPAYAAQGVSDPAFLQDYKDFFTSVMEPGIERAYRQGIEMIEWQSDWRKRDLKSLQQYFAKWE